MESETLVTHPGDVTDVMFAPEQLDAAFSPPIIDVTRMEKEHMEHLLTPEGYEAPRALMN